MTLMAQKQQGGMMQRERVQQHLPRARFLISGLGTLGCFLISSPQPSHPEPPRANVFPCQVKCHPHKTGGGGGGEGRIKNNNLPWASPHKLRRPEMRASPGQPRHINAMEDAVRLGQAPAPVRERDTRSSICVCLSQGENLIKHGVGAWRSWGWGWNIKRSCFLQIRGQY